MTDMDWRPVEYKFILLGDSLVGKSALFTRLSGKNFPSQTISSVGTDKCLICFDKLDITSKGQNTKKNFEILLFDTAGQERYRAITKTYFRDSNGIILIYSINDTTSFEHIQTWLDSIKDSLSDWKKSGYMIMLLGNKLDLVQSDPNNRAVLTEESEQLCKEQEIYWGGEISAKNFTREELLKIMENFLRKVHNKLDVKEEKTQNVKKINSLKKKKKNVPFC